MARYGFEVHLFAPLAVCRLYVSFAHNHHLMSARVAHLFQASTASMATRCMHRLASDAFSLRRSNPGALSKRRINSNDLHLHCLDLSVRHVWQRAPTTLRMRYLDPSAFLVWHHNRASAA